MAGVVVASILSLLAAGAALIVGVVVLRGSQQSVYRRHFVLFATAVFLWIVSNVIYVYAGDDLRYTVALASYGVALLLAIELLVFVLSFARGRLSLRQHLVIYLPGLSAVILSMLPGAVAYGVAGQRVLAHKLGLVVYGVILATYLGVAAYELVVLRSKTKHMIRQQVNLMIIGLVVSAALGMLFNLLLPLLDYYALTQLGPASAAVFVGTVAYAIIRHGLFSVRFAVVRVVSYGATVVAIVAAYALIATAITQQLYGEQRPLWATLVNAAAIIVVALLFQPVWRLFDKLSNRLFYRDNYSSLQFYRDMNGVLMSTADVRTLLTRSADLVARTLKLEQAAYNVYMPGGQYVSAGSERYERISKQHIDTMREYFDKQDRDFIIGDFLPSGDRVKLILAQHSIAGVLPLKNNDRLVGLLLLGSPQSRGFTQRDIRTLQSMSGATMIAIENTLSLKEVKDLNASLKQRIDEATKDLRDRNRELRQLDGTKDEFISMASHQLRTPLTSVKGYLSMVLEGDVGELSRDQRRLLNEAYTSSERMVQLIGDFLNVSRLQTGKFVIEASDVDLGQLVSEEVASLQGVAESKSQTVVLEKPDNLPLMRLDDAKIRQVVMNFIDNAIYYSPDESEIIVQVANDNGKVSVTVTDKGIGVPAEEQAKLFTKFYRASNARTQRPDGTGVGIFLAKKIVDMHNGKVIFSSEEDKGSTFGFSLPKSLAVASAE